MAKFSKISLKWLFVGIFLGGTGGYLYYYYVGCSSGTCPITSNPYVSVLFGTLLGAILFYRQKKAIKPDQGPQE